MSNACLRYLVPNPPPMILPFVDFSRHARDGIEVKLLYQYFVTLLLVQGAKAVLRLVLLYSMFIPSVVIDNLGNFSHITRKERAMTLI